ncbi:MAG: IS200/IS605 family transposase [Bacteroidota bacterium]
MPYTNVMIHFIWSTKDREPIINKELKPVLLNHIKENSIKKGIFIDRLNCVKNHIHLLISLGREQTISKITQLIKGESSFWVNRQHLIRQKFEWQDEYIALSVSESGIQKVRDYIDNQEEHHKRVTFSQEYNELIKIHGFDIKNFG